MTGEKLVTSNTKVNLEYELENVRREISKIKNQDKKYIELNQGRLKQLIQTEEEIKRKLNLKNNFT
jgi:pheromone shutdown protein TraB